MPYFYKISDYLGNYNWNNEWRDAVNFAAGDVALKCHQRGFGNAQGILFIPMNNEDITHHKIEFEFISLQTVGTRHQLIIPINLNEDNNNSFFEYIQRFILSNPNDYMSVYLHMTCVAFQESINKYGFIEPPPHRLLNYEDEEPSPLPQSRRPTPTVRVKVSADEGKADDDDDAHLYVDEDDEGNYEDDEGNFLDKNGNFVIDKNTGNFIDKKGYYLDADGNHVMDEHGNYVNMNGYIGPYTGGKLQKRKRNKRTKRKISKKNKRKISKKNKRKINKEKCLSV